MPRRTYTLEEKRQALSRLDKCGRSFRLTSAETGVPIRTLRKWDARRQEAAPDPLDTGEVLDYLRQRLVHNVSALVDSLEAGIDDAPLHQRAAALSQLIDRLLKLIDKLPPSGKREQVVRLEFMDSDGSIHDTPPWARDDSEG